jgi:aspartate kinase
MTRVLKFGGSSIADAERMRQAFAIVRAARPHAPVVVLSAMGGTTDRLFAAAREACIGSLPAALRAVRSLLDEHRTCARQLFSDTVPSSLAQVLDEEQERLEGLLRGVGLLRELSPRTMDSIAVFGERLSTQAMTALCVREEVEAEFFDARAVIATDERFGCARPKPKRIRERAVELLLPRLGPGRVVITQGYVGCSEAGFTTTLGRGGSDLTAALLGAALSADEVQIWTDVEGVMSADPRRVAGALPISELSFAEAAELAAFGARVLHPATIQPAIERKIPVTVRHTQRPGGRFTTIREAVAGLRPVTALATRGPITILTVTSSRMLAQSGFLARLFEVFARLGVPVDLVATAEVSVSMSVEADAPVEELCAEISSFAKVEVARERAIVALVGERIKKTSGIAARVFEALSGINVEMISMGANEINLSIVVAGGEADEALARLHAALFEKG